MTDRVYFRKLLCKTRRLFLSPRYLHDFMSQRLIDTLIKYAIPIGIGVTALGSSVYSGKSSFSVDGGEMAVIFDRLKGVKKTPIGEGMHVLVPWLQRAIIFDIRTRPRTITSTTGSNDMQTVSLTLRVLHRPDTKNLSNIYSRLGLDYDERVLPSIVNEVLKGIVAQFDASELITQREIVKFWFNRSPLK